MKIAIDIGHANGTGARGHGLEEHAVASRIAGYLRSDLLKIGYEVDVIDYPELSNTDDLNKTVKAANAGGYDLGVSIHCDCSDNPDAHGAHVCYFSASGGKLASDIAFHLCSFLPGRADQTVKRDNLAILKQTRPVWVLCECGFISNEYDAITMDTSPSIIARRIALGIRDYVK